MSSSDVEEVYVLGMKISEFSFSEGTFWPREVLGKIVNSDDVAYVAVDEKLIGFSIALYHAVSEKATIENCYVKKNTEEKGWQKN